MLKPRITPCLLLKDKGLVKTQKFSDPKYVGDPINAVKIFNEKEVDELMVLDIDASVKNTEPDFELIRKLAVECRMPLCYGGGVKTVEHAMKIISIGAEKVAISSEAIKNPAIISHIAKAVGTQSVVMVIDIKYTGIFKKPEIMIQNGKKSSGKDFIEFIKEIEKLGAGEIVINSVDRDGMGNGYDINLVRKVRDLVSIPITVMGGAGKMDDLKELIDEFGVIGASAGSLFVFKGKYKAVLINYPSYEEKRHILGAFK